jgi:hypothetical protein
MEPEEAPVAVQRIRRRRVRMGEERGFKKMRDRNALFARLSAIVIGIPWAVALAFAWLQPLARISPSYGAVIGTLAAAALCVYAIKKAPDQKPALVRVLVIFLFVFLQGIVLFNVIGR